MPIEKSTGSEAEKKRNFHDLRHGKTFRKTEKKYGRAKARSQMIAIALEAQRAGKKKSKKHKKAQHKKRVSKR